MPKAEVYRHWQRVRDLGCVICRSTIDTTIHHAHGGSMKLLPWPNPGMGQKQNDWLVIPLHSMFHVGGFGIDTGQGRFKGVDEWEAELGTQVHHLEWVSRELGYNVFEKAGIDWPIEVPGKLNLS